MWLYSGAMPAVAFLPAARLWIHGSPSVKRRPAMPHVSGLLKSNFPCSYGSPPESAFCEFGSALHAPRMAKALILLPACAKPLVTRAGSSLYTKWPKQRFPVILYPNHFGVFLVEPISE